MKKTVIILCSLFVANTFFAQTPFDGFAPSQNTRVMNELPEVQLKVTNPNIDSEIRYIAFDRNSLSLILLDDEKNVIELLALNPNERKFITPDPLAEARPWESPYAFVGGNPVNRIDPTGLIWENAQDEEIAAELQQAIATRDRALAREEGRISSQIARIENNPGLSDARRERQLSTQQGRLENVQTQRAHLADLSQGITQLGSPENPTVFTFNTTLNEAQVFLDSRTDGTIVINNLGTVGNRAHETTHAIQFDRGLMTLSKPGSNIFNFRNQASKDALEIQAYRTEFSITGGTVPHSDVGRPRTVFGINQQWLHGLRNSAGVHIYRP